MSDLMAIGNLSRKTGVKVPTIRYYEGIGLLPAPPRSEGNRRLYGAKAVDRLRFIRHARELGFEIDAIRTLLQLQENPGQSCAAVDTIAKARLAEVAPVEAVDRGLARPGLQEAVGLRRVEPPGREGARIVEAVDHRARD
ncbi:MAG: helix-turn-helix domain-containing protein [Sphingomonadales bacterium]|nr:helix-turn-helix domain-containing protein [Sphingomonadales bacterium]